MSTDVKHQHNNIIRFGLISVLRPFNTCLGHFGRGQLPYPHCSWASFLGSLPVLSAHSFASNWQLLFLNQRKRENGRRNVFMAKSQRKNVPDVGIELRTSGYSPLNMHEHSPRLFGEGILFTLEPSWPQMSIIMIRILDFVVHPKMMHLCPLKLSIL